MAALIKPIDGKSIHQIQSGQVIVDLCSVVKELLENSVDAGATVIDIRFRNQGLDLIEIQDNGSGISPPDHESLALKHHTSKLSSFFDLVSLQTFGFRGEALASLCALSRLTVTTCLQADVPKGSRLSFESSGKLKETTIVAAQRGTTVSVDHLFHNLPVRRRELERNIKREWQKVIALLNQYACILVNVKISVSQQPTKGKRVSLFSTKSNPTTRENIINIFGAKTMTALVPLDLKLELVPTSSGANDTATSKNPSREVRVLGHISRPFPGDGRQTPDRQMFFVNGRPCGLPQFAKTFNEVYRSYNHSQSPFIFADVQLDTRMYDVNVSPDKRSILLHDQGRLLDILRASLTAVFDTHDCAVPASMMSGNSVSSRSGHEKSVSLKVGMSTEAHRDTQHLIRYRPGPADHISPTHSTSSDSERETGDSVSYLGFSEKASAEPRHDQTAVSQRVKHGSGAEHNSRIFGERHLSEHSHGTPVVALISQLVSGQCETRQKSPATLSSGSDRFHKNLGQEGEEKRVVHSAGGNEYGVIIAGTTPVETKIPAVRSFRSSSHGPQRSLPTRNPVKRTEPMMAANDVGPAGSDTCDRLDEGEKHDTEAVSAGRAEEMPRFMARRRRARSSSSETDTSLLQTPGAGILLPTQGSVSSENDDANETQEPPARRMLTLNTSYLDCPGKKYSAHTVSGEAKDIEGNNEAQHTISQAHDLEYLVKRGNTTRRVVQRLQADEERIRLQLDWLATSWPTEAGVACLADQVEDISASDAESRLTLIISRNDFSSMRVVGQFNLGFIIAVRPASLENTVSGETGRDELFIIDQHASDEKYNFERLQSKTVVQSQHLVHPKQLQLTALEEEIVAENISAIDANGFKVAVDETGDTPVGSRCQVTALPLSRETTFTLGDLEELIALLGEKPPESGHVPRPSKVRKMFAMRACRSSVMIGKALTSSQMYSLVRQMGELDKPWNCPHGRPTMRHLCRLQAWEEKCWKIDSRPSSTGAWQAYQE